MAGRAGGGMRYLLIALGALLLAVLIAESQAATETDDQGYYARLGPLPGARMLS